MKRETHCYAVYENFKELPDSNFSAIQGAAARWIEAPDRRTVRELLPGLWTPLRDVPEEELLHALGMLKRPI